MKEASPGFETAEVFVPGVGKVPFRTSIEELRKTNLLDTVAREVELGGMEPGSRVLECGCGTGVIAHELSGKFEMVGIDISSSSIYAGKKAGLKVGLFIGDLHHLPFADDSFDMVYFYSVLTYLDNAQQALQEVSRILRCGGHLLMYEFNPKNFWVRFQKGWGSRKLISPREYQKMLDGNFEVLTLRENVNYVPTSLCLATGVLASFLRNAARFGEKLARNLPLANQFGGLVFIKAKRL